MPGQVLGQSQLEEVESHVDVVRPDMSVATIIQFILMRNNKPTIETHLPHVHRIGNGIQLMAKQGNPITVFKKNYQPIHFNLLLSRDGHRCLKMWRRYFENAAVQS